MTRIRRVAPEDAAAVAHLTYPAYRHILTEPDDRDLEIFAVDDDGEPVGLSFAWRIDNGEAELVSHYVDPWHREDSLNAELLGAVESACRAAGTQWLSHFATVWDDDRSFGEFLVRSGWRRPRLRQLVCRTDVAHALRTPWLVRARLPEGYRVVDWADVPTALRRELAMRAERGEAFWPELLDPFCHEESIFAPTSVALLDAERVRGWILCHVPEGTGTVRWTISWVDEGIQGIGRIVPLWREAVERQAQRTSYSDFMWTVPVELPRMCRFVQRRMRPYLTRLGYACTFLRELG